MRSSLNVRAVNMAVYIDVIVDISVNSLDRIFQYRVPEELLDAVTVGCQVNVPSYSHIVRASSLPAQSAVLLPPVLSSLPKYP